MKKERGGEGKGGEECYLACVARLYGVTVTCADPDTDVDSTVAMTLPATAELTIEAVSVTDAVSELGTRAPTDVELTDQLNFAPFIWFPNPSKAFALNIAVLPDATDTDCGDTFTFATAAEETLNELLVPCLPAAESVAVMVTPLAAL